MNKKNIKEESTGGFTLLEVVVATGIMIVVLVGVMFSYPRYVQMMNLRKGIQLLASDIRRVQVYGISVKENPMGSDKFPAYGLHFDFLNVNLGNKAYYVFADNNGNSRYDSGEELSKSSVPAPGYIYDICSNWETGSVPECAKGCRSTPPLLDISGLDIIFRRPVPDVKLYRITGGAPVGPCSDVEIVVMSPRISDPSSSKRVIVWRTGQIAVE